MRFRQTFIEKVRESANIVDIISQYTELKRSGGGQLKGLCPFPDHNEKTPSFSVSEDKNVYYCFGCGKSGNVFTFLENYRGLNFPEAIEYLAGRASLPLEFEEEADAEKNRREPSAQGEKSTLLRLNQLAMDFYHQSLKQLPTGHAFVKYCEKRQLSQEIIDIFKIGIAPNEWQALTHLLQKKKAPLALAERNGLIKKRNNGDGFFDLFRERLMFPILSPSGEVLGFGGRTFGDGQPKYLNSPETLVFNKRKTLYGLHETAKHIRIEDQVILVEGYMDLLAMYAAGIKNVVAVLGTAFTEDHARKLKRYTKNVIVLLDGDEAGERAAERSLPILLSQGLYPKQITLASGQDPDDFIRDHGVEALREKIRSADEFYLKFVDRMITEYGNEPVGKVKLVDRIGPILRAVDDDRLKMLYFRETVDRLGVDENWLKNALRSAKDDSVSVAGQAGGARAGAPRSAEKPTKIAPSDEKWRFSQAPKGETELLAHAIQGAHFWQEVEKADIFEMLSPETLPCYLWIRDQYRQAPENFDKLPALLASKVDPPSLVIRLQEAPQDEAFIERDLKRIHDCIKWIQARHLDRMAKVTVNEIKGDPTPEQLERFMNIQKMKRSLKAPEKLPDEGQ